ncbi:MAG: adenosylcobinamide-phosphate synthase CbiB [Pseudomonadota bacterium]
MSAAALMLLAWGIEAAIGWPAWVYNRIRHPVVWFGRVVTAFDTVLNRPAWPHRARYVAGMISTLSTVLLATGLAYAVAILLPPTWWGYAGEALIASSLIASRSLYDHVVAVAKPLAAGKLDQARDAVSRIVGRDTNRLDEAGIARAGLESLAENTSDGIIAPIFWGAIFGLPGLAAYKAINTLDSMIGHKNETYAAFGGFAARLDDGANLVPARLTALLIVAAGLGRCAVANAIDDARRHRSPNAGWPEAAMAGSLGVRLSGPRRYASPGHGPQISDEPWLNETGRDPQAADMVAGLALYRRALALAALLLGLVALAQTLGALLPELGALVLAFGPSGFAT